MHSSKGDYVNISTCFSRIILFTLCILVLPSYILGSVVSNGKEKAYVGIDFTALRLSNMKKLHLTDPEGVLVTDVRKGSPAYKSGLRVDDVIIKVDTFRVNSTEEFRKILAQYSKGDKATVSYIRNANVVNQPITFAAYPKPPKPKRLSFNNHNLELLKQQLDIIDKYNKSMGSLAIGQNEKVLYSRALGYRYIDADTILRADADTKYRIGSISKMFTSVMIFQLIEESKLTLDTKLNRFFPGIPNSEAITIAMMLSHQSGIFSFTEIPDYAPWSLQPRTHDEIMEKIIINHPVFSPGEKYEYSNSNYLLLGYIIELLDNNSYAISLEKRITSLIGLHNTYYGGKIDPANNEAFSYNNYGYWQASYESDMSIPGGAGSIVSTASDLVVFIGSLFQGDLISRKSLKGMLETKEGTGSGIFELQLGWTTYYGHTGFVDNFHSILIYSPKNKYAMAYISNGDADVKLSVIALITGALSGRIMNIPRYYDEVKATGIDKYKGSYYNDELQMNISVDIINGDVYTQADNQDKIRLEAVLNYKFECAAMDLSIEFNSDNKLFKLTQYGETYTFIKTN